MRLPQLIALFADLLIQSSSFCNTPDDEMAILLWSNCNHRSFIIHDICFLKSNWQIYFYQNVMFGIQFIMRHVSKLTLLERECVC